MNLTFIVLALSILAVEKPAADNPIFEELICNGVRMSDGSAVRLPPPIMPDRLDAAGQWAAMEKVATGRNPVEKLVQKSFYAPVVVRVRTVKPSEGEGPAIRTVDFGFVAHGDWDVLTSKKFIESFAGAKDKGPNRVVSKSGTLSDEEMTERKLSTTNKDGYEERFVYTTFSLFERVELSATRLAGLTRGEDSWLAAARIDRRFDKDPEYPNQWRPLLRDVRAEIKPGPAHPFLHAGGYAKITRLKKPADAVFVECHLAYEEDYGWFDGVNLVKRKVSLMIREKVRTFRRKLAVASEEKAKKEKN